MATPPSSRGPAGSDGPQRRSVLGPSGTSGPGGAAGSSSGGAPAWGRTSASDGAASGTRRAAAGARGSAGTSRTGGAGRAAAGSRASAAKGRKPARRRLIDYPRFGKSGVRRWLPSWRLVLGTGLTAFALGIGAFVALYVTTPIPSPADFAEAQTTTVYYADGTTRLGTFGETNRVIVDADAIPQEMKDAVVAGEDRTFYTNPGVDPVGIARAFYTNVRGGTRQGGSSITQQYAERFYFDDTVSSYQGKIREAILAIKLDRAQDKDEIISNYLNTIYFGRDSYGIETASKAYFGVSAADLTVSQAALLAGVVPSPNNFDPRASAEQAERRWNYVLDGMVATGSLTQAERDAQTFPETIEFARSDTLAGEKGYLLKMVKDEIVAKTPLTEDDLLSRGYAIVTTIDKGLEDAAVAAVGRMPEDKPDNVHVALVTLNPADGAIVSLYGGPDYLTQARNAVTQDGAQAGSTFKPFALVAYLENGGSLKSTYSGNTGFPMAGFPDGKVSNYSSHAWGTINVLKATAQSVNTVYAQINQETGPEKTVDVAVRAGLPEDTIGLNDNLSNVLGPASPHPLNMAAAYNTFAAGGLRSDPFIVRSVASLDGTVVHEGGSTPKRVFAEDVMADTTYAMQGVTKSGGTATKAGAFGYPVAGKTGTSTDNRSAWFVGFTRQLTTAVALYQVGPNGEEERITPFGGYSAITGGSAPTDLWADYMAVAMEGREVEEFPPPAYVGKPNVPEPISIPDVVGKTEAQARTDLGAAGFGVEVVYANDPDVGSGLVTSMDPTGRAIPRSTITLTVSQGPGTTPVPDVVGRSERAATAALEKAGFVVAVETATDEDVPEGRVIASNPDAGSDAPSGATVTIVVSEGPAVEPDPTPTPEPTPVPTPTETIAPDTTGALPGAGDGRG